SLSSFSAPELGSAVILECIKTSGIKPDDVQEVVMGNVLTAVIGQAP
ncbi:MAG: acetyl-CoA C-acetyltransferase, partial [candidate division Zixibacteria bacterium]|nr:acetyl-CoA C-acetyltransferase [Candidatus Bathyarchaeota archaeon]NIR46867.1 acetyl-CoA C-acetyltransferase [candidate division KSB1 bacterium]NIV04642.1 acetyl-CoA C-acetyltransferase [candidate division Zixibacteria bacterium]NIS22482.1 acetyl-CoA C-acetyltransferase [candidate division KSB1 bacterium]NIT69330.1 acetyl-CoA C-acetyltransferase [candidate division KSB1 bacterium]